MTEQQGTSLNPESFTEGGGLIDDVNVTWDKVQFAMFDYQGKAAPVPTIKVSMTTEEREEAEQYWSMGSANDWAPSPDGKRLIAVGSATGIRASSNGGILLKSLADSGFPMDTIGDDVSALAGLQCHMIRIPAPKRPGLKKTKREDGREFEDTILVVDNIIALPGEKKKAAGAPATKAKKTVAKKAAAKATPTPAVDVTEKAAETVLAIILDEGGEVAKKVLPTKVFAALKTDPDRNAISKLVFDDEFLGSREEWAYDPESGVLSMPE